MLHGVLVLGLMLSTGAPPSKGAPRPDVVQQLLAPDGFDTLGAERAVLVASGADTEAALNDAWKELDRTLVAVVDALNAQDDPHSQLTREEKLHRVMHVLVLHRFRWNLGDVRVTLKTGDYNCLTATTLYVLAARRAGIAASAYGMRRHVVPLVFGANGARFLEMTTPTARLMTEFVYPQGRYREALAESSRSAVTLRVKGARLGRLMATGDDAEAIEVVPRAQDEREREARAQAEARKMKESTFDADERGLAALLFWNRSIDFLVANKPEQGLACLQAMVTLGSAVLQEKTREYRILVLDDMLQELGGKKGWPAAVEVLDHLRTRPMPKTEQDAMVGLRVALVEELAAGTPGKESCAQVRRLQGLGPGDYTRAVAWACQAP